MIATRVYFNLHKRCLSVQQKQKNSNGNLVWKVVRHAENILLKDAKFKVSEAGRQRVIKEKKKNVHAFVEGFEVPFNGDETCLFRHVFYNPYKFESFVDSDYNSIKEAPLAIVNGKFLGYSIFIK
ncbi:hypothetical protein N9955_00545 [bacterium]|nr:hypothetical protein [bacterium]